MPLTPLERNNLKETALLARANGGFGVSPESTGLSLTFPELTCQSDFPTALRLLSSWAWDLRDGGYERLSPPSPVTDSRAADGPQGDVGGGVLPWKSGGLGFHPAQPLHPERFGVHFDKPSVSLCQK